MDVSAYDHATPCWVDMSVPDVDAAKAFYTQLFGWDAVPELDDEGNLIYTSLKMNGKDVAGLGGHQPGMEGMPAIWNSYVNVEDADQITKAVEAAGGTTIMPPMDVMDAGRMAVFMDPTGAAFCVWQANNHIGAQLVNEPNTYSWNELMSRDLAAAKDFYTEVFGWEYAEEDMGPMGMYTVVQGGQNGGLAGMMNMPADVPEQVPNYWGVYFSVEDTVATVEKAKELGATVLFGPNESPVGMLAGIQDPQGGTFSLMQPADQH